MGSRNSRGTGEATGIFGHLSRSMSRSYCVSKSFDSTLLLAELLGGPVKGGAEVSLPTLPAPFELQLAVRFSCDGA